MITKEKLLERLEETEQRKAQAFSVYNQTVGAMIVLNALIQEFDELEPKEEGEDSPDGPQLVETEQ